MCAHAGKMLTLTVILWKMYMFQENSRGLMSINTVFVEQDGGDYIRPNADLEMRPYK